MAIEGVIITLPKDPNVVLALVRKKEEYGKRFEHTNNPALWNGDEWDAFFKFELLKRLFQKGEVDTWELSRELTISFSGIFTTSVLNAFLNACAVVDNYCKNGVREAA